MVNISSQSFSPAVVVSFLSIQVIPLIKADTDDQLYFTGITAVIFGCINYTHTYVAMGLQFSGFKLLGDFPGFARPNGISIYIETAIVVVISFVLLLQVNSSYIWLAVFPVITIGFILALSNEINRQKAQNGSQQRDEGEASSAGSGGGLGSGMEMKKAEEEEEQNEGEASNPGSGGDLGTGKETNKAERQDKATLVVYWVLCIMGQFHSAANFAVSLFLLFLSFTLGALTRMMMELAQTKDAPGGAAASALLRKASLAVLLVAVHAMAVELLGEQVVLFILPELAPLLLWLSVHVDRAKEGAIITADQITLSTNLVSAVAVVVLACLAAVSMDESMLSWVAMAVVSCGVSGLLVCYLVFMISQWQGQDAETTLFLEMVKLLKVWAKVLLMTAVVLLVSTSAAALRLGLHVQMLAAPAEFFNKYVTSSSTL